MRKIHQFKRIDPSHAESVANLVATRRFTETEACGLLDIKATAWFNWKSRHIKLFNDTLVKCRAAKMNKVLNDIEIIADGDDSRKLKPDWRAKQFILQVTDSRFILGTSATPTIEASASPAITDAMRRAFASPVIDIESSNAVIVPESNQTLLMDTQRPLRAIPPRKHKADGHPQPDDGG